LGNIAAFGFDEGLIQPISVSEAGLKPNDLPICGYLSTQLSISAGT